MADWRKANPARRGTNIDDFETNPFAHKYLLKRPRTHESEPVSRTTSRASLAGLEADDTLIFNPAVEKRRFELFIDLIWVGIIGNLAANFSEQAFRLHGARIELGRAVFGFIIIFLLAWRIWKFLQEFMSKYSTKKIIERTFVVWALMLAMLYGNNAPISLPERTSLM